MNMIRRIAGAAGLAAAIAVATPGAAAPTKAAGKPVTPAKNPATKSPAEKGNVTRAQLIAQVKQVFARADTDHDGFISRSEFAVRMGAILNRTPPGTPGAPTPEEAQRMLNAANAAFSAVDKNGDGKLSLAEASARPLRVFDEMDTNHDGILTLAEKAAAHREGEESKIGPSVDGPPGGPGR